MLQNLIRNYIKQRKIELMLERESKFEAIRREVYRYYKDVELMFPEMVDLPYYVKAADALKNAIKTDEDIDYYYNRLNKWKKKTA